MNLAPNFGSSDSHRWKPLEPGWFVARNWQGRARHCSNLSFWAPASDSRQSSANQPAQVQRIVKQQQWNGQLFIISKGKIIFSNTVILCPREHYILLDFAFLCPSDVEGKWNLDQLGTLVCRCSCCHRQPSCFLPNPLLSTLFITAGFHTACRLLLRNSGNDWWLTIFIRF